MSTIKTSEEIDHTRLKDAPKSAVRPQEGGDRVTGHRASL
jgi:hypothetical protein